MINNRERGVYILLFVGFLAVAVWAGTSHMQGSLSIGDDLTVTDDATFGDDVTVTGDLDVSGSQTFGTIAAITVADATVTDDLIVTDDCTLGDDVSIGGDLTAVGSITATTALTVADATITDDLIVTDDVAISGDITTVANLTVTTALTVPDATASDDLVVVDDASIGGDLSVTGTTTSTGAIAGPVNVVLNTDGTEVLTAGQSGAVITNTTAVALTVTLPDAAAGLVYHFTVLGVAAVNIDPSTTADQIKGGLTDSGGDKIQNAGTVGDHITLVGVNGSTWLPISEHGTWSDAN